jgi:hypothetical protein
MYRTTIEQIIIADKSKDLAAQETMEYHNEAYCFCTALRTFAENLQRYNCSIFVLYIVLYLFYNCSIFVLCIGLTAAVFRNIAHQSFLHCPGSASQQRAVVATDAVMH